MTTFRITGTVIDRETGSGVPRLRVETWDKDLIFDDLVGTAITDDQGTFQIEFDETYFQELFLDQRPDLYFKVFGYGQLIRNTEDSVLWNVGAGDTTVTIEVDIPEQPQGRTCATMEIHRGLLRDPEYARSRREIESFTRYYIQRNAGTGLRTGIVRIPVVVHVVYNTAAQNISDAQIQSQIDILNQDYRRLNVDVGSVPGVFAPLTADARIEFQLAVRDPNCNLTTGITRTSTSVTAFSYSNAQAGTPAGEPVKFASSGGHDAWPRNKYLNLWVCNLGGGLLGYAQFPADPWPATDGVVINYTAFGNTGTAAAPYDRGRTATHEIGHWLNLLHIWGDDDLAANQCSGDDQVADTPNQRLEHYGCPSFPQVSCGNGPNGDMFMNYMDYTDDACMFMFTAGQVARMDAALAIAPRAALLGSDGLIPPPSPATPDLWSQNTPQDIGDEPDSLSATFYQSDDIWVRTTNDGLVNQEHQNPQYRPPALGLPNYVYVRVRNRGCASASSATLKLYWAKASTGLSWPTPWDGSDPMMGGSIIPSQPTGSVAGGGFVILEFPWYPRNPLDYISFGADRSHFCLLSRIETSATPPYGMTFPEGSDLGANVRNNNNIVWKNVDVVEASPGGGRRAWVTIGNFEPEELRTKLVFTTPKEAERQKTVFEWATVKVYLGKRLFQKWQNGDQVGSGIEVSGRYTIQILESDAWIGNIKLSPKELYTLRAEVKPFENLPQGNEIFFLDVLQYASGYAPDVSVTASTAAIVERFVGGQRFVFKTIYVPPDPDILNLWIWDGVDWVIPPDTDTAEVPVI